MRTIEIDREIKSSLSKLLGYRVRLLLGVVDFILVAPSKTIALTVTSEVADSPNLNDDLKTLCLRDGTITEAPSSFDHQVLGTIKEIFVLKTMVSFGKSAKLSFAERIGTIVEISHSDNIRRVYDQLKDQEINGYECSLIAPSKAEQDSGQLNLVDAGFLLVLDSGIVVPAFTDRNTFWMTKYSPNKSLKEYYLEYKNEYDFIDLSSDLRKDECAL